MFIFRFRDKLNADEQNTNVDADEENKYVTVISKLQSELKTEKQKAAEAAAELQQNRSGNAAKQQAKLDEVNLLPFEA